MRYRFVKDDDGHNYIIPAHMYSMFVELQTEDYIVEFNYHFENSRCDSVSNWTFENPKEE